MTNPRFPANDRAAHQGQMVRTSHGKAARLGRAANGPDSDPACQRPEAGVPIRDARGVFHAKNFALQPSFNQRKFP